MRKIFLLCCITFLKANSRDEIDLYNMHKKDTRPVPSKTGKLSVATPIKPIDKKDTHKEPKALDTKQNSKKKKSCCSVQ